MLKIYDLSLELGNFEIFILPLTYAILVYAFRQMRRMSSGLLIASLGLGFFLVLLLTPASPGWFLWVVPLLVMHQIQSGKSSIFFTGLFSILLIAFNVLHSSGATIRLFDADFAAPMIDTFDDISARQSSLLLSALLAAGAILAYRLARDGIRDSDTFGLRSRPFVMGIAGDSGAGKDTLTDAIQGLFGGHSVAHVSGDDFHRWDREQPLWQTTTHLNPRANDLSAFTSSIIDLIDSRSVSIKPYDHATGRFRQTTSLHHNDFVIVTGLLALYVPQLRERYDMKIFLDMDESLRQHLKLKRDVEARGHSADQVQETIDSRLDDAKTFIRPQEEHADIVFRIEPVRADQLKQDTAPQDIRLQLGVSLRRSLYHETMIRLLVGECGVRVEHDIDESGTSIELIVDGDVSGEDLRAVASRLVPQSGELLDVKPEWQDGMIGVMQLIVLAQTAGMLRERIS